jgi:exonuclease VII large subunit
MRFPRIGALVVGLGVLWVSLAQAQQVGFTQEDRERIDRRFDQVEKHMVRIETTLQMFMESTAQRFEQVDKRFAEQREDFNTRFEQVDKRFAEQREDFNTRFEQMQNSMNTRFEQRQNSMNTRFAELMQFLQIITAIFTVIMVAAIGFAFWDRRTVLAKSKEVALEALAKDEEIRKIALVEQVTDEVLRRMDVRKATPLQAPPSPATA